MPKELTLLEYINDKNEWAYYSLHHTLSESEAIRQYCIEHELECGSIFWEHEQGMDMYYSSLVDVRAYKVAINE